MLSIICVHFSRPQITGSGISFSSGAIVYTLYTILSMFSLECLETRIMRFSPLASAHADTHISYRYINNFMHRKVV